MGLTKKVLKRPVTTLLVILCLIVFGLSSVFSSQLELIPEMEMPMLVINAVYPGASPEDVDELVTKVIEDEVGTLNGVDSMTSMSAENYAIILLQYDYGKNLDDAYDDLKKKLDGISSSLPDDVKTPSIIEMNINDTPAITLAVNNDRVDNLQDYVNNDIVPELEKLTTVASIGVSGGQSNYVKVELIPEKLEQYHLGMSAIAQMIGSADYAMPLGDTKVGNKKLSVSSGADFDSIERLKKIPITLGKGNMIYLEDVANVHLALEEQSSIGRYNGKDTIALSIKKNNDASYSELTKDVTKITDSLKAEDPDLDIVVVNDYSDSIDSSLQSVFKTMVMAVIVSMAIIWLFFGDVKASLIVGTSIPVSILAALILMKALGFTLNVITLSSLVLGVGMMVDNSITVLESCFRSNKGGGFVEGRNAALEGTGTIYQSILGGTATTCVVFIPLALLKGMSGQMFKPLGYTIIFCMIASLVSAITLVPLCYTYYRPKEKTENPASKIMRSLQNGYRSLMRKLLKHKALVMLSSVVMLILSFVMAGQLGMELMVAGEANTIGITIETQPGLTVDRVDDVLRKAEEYIVKDPDLDSYMLSYGSTGLSMSGGSGGGASITAYLKKDRARKTGEILKEWKREFQTWSGCSISLEEQNDTMSSSMMASSADSAEYILVSTDYDKLKTTSDQIVEKLQARPEITHVHSSLENNAPVVKVSVDPVKAAAEGLTPVQVSGQIYSMLSGTKATTLNVNGDDVDVRVEYPDDRFETIDQLQAIVLPTAGGNVALRDIAQIGFKDSPQTITKSDKQYQVTISGTLTDLADSTTKDKLEAEIIAPYLNTTINTKQNTMDEMMGEEFGALGKAIATAVFLVFVVMAAQFESPKFSLMVMTTIPFALIGSFGFLWLADSPISMVSLLGFLILVGTVVNNGILYVDTVNQYRVDMDLDNALIEAGATRMRPIFMTTLTTIVAMIPMALAYGDSGKMMQGLALVDVGGLVASTALCLLVLPIYYKLMNKGKKTENDYD